MRHLTLKQTFTKLPKSYPIKPGELVVCPDPDIVVAGNAMHVCGVMLGNGQFLRLGLFYDARVADLFADKLRPEEMEKFIRLLAGRQ